MKNLLLILIGIVPVIGIVAGCGGDAKKSAEEILEMSRQSMSEVESYHFEVDMVVRIPSTQTEAAQERELSRLVADVAAPGRLKAKLSSVSMFAGDQDEMIEAEVVTIGETTYTTDLDTKEWESRPRTDDDLVMSRVAGIVVNSMKDPTKLVDEKVDGVLSYRLKGNVGPEVLGPGSDDSTPETIPAEIWIGKGDQLVRQVRLELEFQGAQIPGTIMVFTLTLSRFNEPVTVEIPVDAAPIRTEVSVGENNGDPIRGASSKPAIPTPNHIWTSPTCEPDIVGDSESFTERIRTLELGFRSPESGGVTQVPAESLMVAGDLNVMDVQMTLQYRIEDLDDFVSNVADPEGCPDGRTLRSAAQAALSEVLGQRSFDDLLTESAGIAADIRDRLQEILDDYQTGIGIANLTLQSVQPPSEVREAFLDVARARQDKETVINQALAYQYDLIPRTRAEGQMIVIDAEASREVGITQAEADVDRFVSIIRAYATEGVQGLRVLHLNSLDEILPGISAYILAVEDSSDTVKTSGLSPQNRTMAKPLLQIVPSGRTLPESTTEFFDKLLWVDPPAIELLDQDKQALIIDVYIRYRIVDQVLFLDNLQSETVAQDRIGSLVIAALRDEVASSSLPEIIGSSIERDESGDTTVVPTDSRSEIMGKVLAAAGDQILNQNLGIELIDARIKQVGFPTEVVASIFARMRAEQQRIAIKLRAEGEFAATQTRADTDRQVTIILAESRLVADAISTEGERKALEIFRNALAQVPELSVYLKSLDAYGVSRGLSD